MFKKKAKIWAIATALIIFIAVPLFANQVYNFLLQAPSKDETPQRFIIKPGQALSQIAANLQSQHLVKNALAFRLLVQQMGITNTIQAGDYRLSPNLTAREIAQKLTHGAIDIWVTFPEGKRIEEVAQIYEEKLNISSNESYKFSKEEFLKYAKEGYMFPDTYLIPKDITGKDAAEKLLNTFDAKVDQRILLDGAKSNLTQNQVVILASVIEREAKTDEEKPIIAGIILNRLNSGMALQIDATVQYAKGYSSANKTWWPQVTVDDYRSVKSTYNTYTNTGLPPAPICNPGLESIRAASKPADTEYVYYIHDSKGKIHYAKTSEQHQQNIQKYL